MLEIILCHLEEKCNIMVIEAIVNDLDIIRNEEGMVDRITLEIARIEMAGNVTIATRKVILAAIARKRNETRNGRHARVRFAATKIIFNEIVLRKTINFKEVVVNIVTTLEECQEE
jgi:hypothetical protein